MARRRRRLPNVLHAGERKQFLDAARAEIERAPSPAKRRAAQRDHLLVQIGLTMGLRVSELIGLNIEHLDFEGRNCLIAQGKGDKDRYVPIPPAVVAALKTWLGERTSGPVFQQPNGRRLAKRTVQLRVKRIAKRGGIARNVKCHTLRHSFATRMVDLGSDIRLVQELMGHASIATTECYLHVSTERMRAAVDRAADESP